MTSTTDEVRISEALGFDRFSIWGTSVVLGVTDSEQLVAARKILDEVLACIEQAASRFRPDTEIHSVNAYAGQGPIMVSATMFDLVAQALRAAVETDGACDPTVADSLIALGYDRDFDQLRPSSGASKIVRPAPGIGEIDLDQATSTITLPLGVHLDLGATAKARAADLAAERIANQLEIGSLVDIGGDLRVCGPAPHDGWIIGITPSARVTDPGAAQEIIAITQGGMASSSTTVRTWESDEGRHHHIIDPRTGRSAETPFTMCTVVASTCVEANAFSTAALVWGEEAPFVIAQRSLPARFARTDGDVERIGGWPEPEPSGASS
jgi:thiamine biosynthesis lipoprotein